MHINYLTHIPYRKRKTNISRKEELCPLVDIPDIQQNAINNLGKYQKY